MLVLLLLRSGDCRGGGGDGGGGVGVGGGGGGGGSSSSSSSSSKKCKAVPLQNWSGPEGSRNLRFQIS